MEAKKLNGKDLWRVKKGPSGPLGSIAYMVEKPNSPAVDRELDLSPRSIFSIGWDVDGELVVMHGGPLDGGLDGAFDEAKVHNGIGR
ncbi:hypothetical protein AMTR_s00004p00248570 [Amborella trichopoda]|uniref:Uncharacterized protein n=1 Tax=Amborella trichopoda TaxID=13333 RepID=W1NDL3_AMBTC|nr:hypothetical protein AMTR_s00004p00248570 [Amborella trichopoda]